MLIRMLMTAALVLALGGLGQAATTDREKDLKRYAKIAKARKVFCICQVDGKEGKVGFLSLFASDDHVLSICRIPTYNPDGSRLGSIGCATDPEFYHLVGP